ncbi:MAG: hypothetical protein GMKNLPBB_03188 [Myxococcota bacterium]|nr:hypothetical protein [Myxococcota bacterium]
MSFRPSRASGHVWTILGSLRDRVFPTPGPPSRSWTTALPDKRHGAVQLHGRWTEGPDPHRAVLIIHGMGGYPDAPYVNRAASAALGAGLSSLRLGLRGSELKGEDLYHGGLIEDIRAALESPELRQRKQVFILGYSLGGHIALRAAALLDHPHLAAVTAICAPLHLGITQQAIDAPLRAIYRQALLIELKRLYRQLAARGREPSPVKQVMAARSIREWDELTVVPRFGFRGAGEYYNTMSAADVMGRIQRPLLIVQARQDPMVTEEVITPFTGQLSASTTLCWLDQGGHVFVPGAVHLGEDGPSGLESQAVCWMTKRV